MLRVKITCIQVMCVLLAYKSRVLVCVEGTYVLVCIQVTWVLVYVEVADRRLQANVEGNE